jgi:hypothetical protein
MGLREHSSRGVALEDAAGCPACLSPPGRRGEEEMETISVENIPKAKKALGALKKLIMNRKALKKVGMAIAELLIDFTAISAAVSISLVIPSILSNLPAELSDKLVPVTVGGAASLVTLTVADLKKLLLKLLREMG